jgi:hypothetical protein
MARDLLIDPIDEIEFDDIANLVSEEVEEGIRLEFKRDLSTSDGQPDRWMRDQSAIGRVARDDIANLEPKTWRRPKFRASLIVRNDWSAPSEA